MIRVFIADDHPIFAQGLAGFVSAMPDMEVVAIAEDGHRALQLADETEWDVAVLDISMPRFNGLEVLRRLVKSFPERKVLLLSQFPESQFGARALREGAAGYVSKSDPPEHAVEAIRCVAAGRRMPLSPASHDDTNRPPESRLPHETLTPREYQVFTLVAGGRGVTEVAVELDVAPSTVSNHLLHIKEKLGAATIGGIVSYAHRMGLVE